MRKMRSSLNAASRILLSASAVARLRPKGFSTTTRAPSVLPEFAICCTTMPKIAGGIAR